MDTQRFNCPKCGEEDTYRLTSEYGEEICYSCLNKGEDSYILRPHKCHNPTCPDFEEHYCHSLECDGPYEAE